MKTAAAFQTNDVSEITITALSKTDANMSDSVRKIIPIHVGTIAENTSTVGKTKDVSFDEKIAL